MNFRTEDTVNVLFCPFEGGRKADRRETRITAKQRNSSPAHRPQLVAFSSRQAVMRNMGATLRLTYPSLSAAAGLLCALNGLLYFCALCWLPFIYLHIPFLQKEPILLTSFIPPPSMLLLLHQRLQVWSDRADVLSHSHRRRST